MKLTQGKIFGILTLLLVVMSGFLSAQRPATPNPMTSEAISYPIRQAPLVNTLNMSAPGEEWAVAMRNTKIIHAPGLDIPAEEFAKAKAEANRLKQEHAGSNASQKTTGTQADMPTVANTFFGNFADGIPNDNTIAVGRSGYVVSATNSRVFTFNTSGGGNTSLKTLASFYASSNLVYDPKLIFDQTWNRFILVYLNGDHSSTSRVVVCFSETADPNGNWKVYTLPGNPDSGTFGSTWADFPQIAINGKELFITVNLFSNSNLTQGAYVYQVNKVDGYTSAATIDWKGWGFTSITDHFAMYPAQGCSNLYGKSMYMVSTRSSPFGQSNQFWLHEITDSLSSSSVAFNTYTVSGNLTYGISPDADQAGSTQDLDTRDCRVRGCMKENGRIYLGMNARVSNRSGLYIGVMEGIEQPAFAFVDGSHIGSDTLEYGFPGFTCGGCLSADGGDNSALIFYNIASNNHFPGTGVSFMDSSGAISNTAICKIGATYVAMGGGGPSRWGDYTEISSNPDNPGEGFGAGYYGYSPSSHLHGTYISHIYSPCAPVVSNEPSIEPVKSEVVLFPNPSMDNVKMTFSVPETSLYDAELVNMKGEKLGLLMHDKLSKGEGVLSFDTQYLKNGVYLIRVSNENGPIFTEKLVVVH